MNDDAKTQIRQTWDAAAEGYAAWDETLGRELVPATRTLFDLAGVAPGMRVLDLDAAARQAAWDEVSAHLRQWESVEGFTAERQFSIAGGARK